MKDDDKREWLNVCGVLRGLPLRQSPILARVSRPVSIIPAGWRSKEVTPHLPDRRVAEIRAGDMVEAIEELIRETWALGDKLFALKAEREGGQSDFTKEQLREIVREKRATLWSDLAAFALAQMERAENAEAENAKLRACVDNCGALARRKLHKEPGSDWRHIHRFCSEVGFGGSVLRSGEAARAEVDKP